MAIGKLQKQSLFFPLTLDYSQGKNDTEVGSCFPAE